MCNGNCKCKEIKVADFKKPTPPENQNGRSMNDIKNEIEQYFDSEHKNILKNFNHHEFKQIFIRINDEYKKEILAIFDKEKYHEKS